ncbi:MAG TPA: PAC2 family protein [Propionibacteriaceae bacterium]|nr:PAC2 family protein [Propionibacteriaceae bacterium]
MDESLRNLRRPVVLLAFEGWNDAADAATAVVAHVGLVYDADVVYEIDGDDFYDYQQTRPRVVAEGENHVIEWPTTTVAVAHADERDFVLITGPEPNMRWRGYSQSIMTVLRSVQPELVVVMGAMLTEEPHSRPLHVMAVSDDPGVRDQLGVQPSEYEGPTGIVGIIADACQRAGYAVVSVWGSVPHYVSNPPNPKATLAMLRRLEDLLNETLELGELPELAAAWERGVNQLASDDPEVAEYVARLERNQDASDLPEASGDSIAAEFQRYFRRHEH